MYKQERKVRSGAATASTPEMWAANFARSRRLGWWRELRLRRWYETRLLRRHLPPGGRVLDAGCGPGEWVILLRNLGFDAEGLDYSPELVARLRQEYPDLRWNSGDIRQMPYPDDSFDGIISWGVIEHDEAGPQLALREFFRVTRPGGVIAVTVPRDSERRRAASEAWYPPGEPDTAFFQYLISEDELSGFLREAGFEVLVTDTTRQPGLDLLFPGHPFKGLVAGALSAAVRFLFRWTDRYDGMIICIGRKPR
jgi:SAM-dependent methyltransferase